MDVRLLGGALAKYGAGLIVMAVLLFVPAGTLRWPQGWLLMGVLFIPMFIAGLVMVAKAPDLLRKRLNMRENESEQRAVVALSGLMFVVAFVLAGLNFRFGWCVLPWGASIAGVAVFLTSYVLYAEVLRENAYLSRTVEVQEGQRVVDTGLYGIVRHPMYAVTTLLFLAMPVVLGSLPSLVVMCAYIPIIVKRIRNEESVLEQGLSGYREYEGRVRYRLVPLIW
ncbi:methyltransferase family protein [Slackia heliotrinireducens]|uniref:methyltransferase family protein n=1 Tax=Slackia heliotrinireducens TaxID=84110 RepID=UPI0033163CF6